MRLLLTALVLCIAVACAGKERRDYPNRGTFIYFDMTAGDPGGHVDTTGVRYSYPGALQDSIEDLGVVATKIPRQGKSKADALRELKKEALKLKADGIYQVEYDIDDDTIKADGYAFRFRE